MADERNKQRSARQRRREQAVIDAEVQLGADPSKAASYQMGTLDAAADRTDAAGRKSGTARRADRASGQRGDADSATDAEQALYKSRGNKEKREHW